MTHTFESLVDALPDSTDMRTAARVLREEGFYEMAMRFEDAALIVAAEEQYAQHRESHAGLQLVRGVA